MMMKVICYELVNPIVYNRGTKYERSCKEFLKGYFCGTDEEAEKRIAELNAQPIKMEEGKEVKRYFLDRQEEMY